MSDSESSSLSTPPVSDDEMPQVVASSAATKASASKKKGKKNGNILSFFKNKTSPEPPRKKRPASPPHDYVPEDNPDIAFLVMFRSRFTDAFPPKSPNVGPQDIERGVASELPSPQIESLLCAILGLVLNRKKPVERGHYGRALEEAIQTQRSQWPREWGGVNPISGGRSFNTMSATERIVLLKTLALWGLATCEAVKKIINDRYKVRTSKIIDDSNVPLSVQPWGRDGDHRRYWLIEGQDDTPFRVYRESNPKLKTNTWWSVAGSIEEIRALAQKLKTDDGSRDAKQLSDRMLNAIPRFEASEEKIKKRQYRQQLKSRWQRPEPGFSMYEGRTRGKRMKYTFSDEEDQSNSDAFDLRRSTRNSGRVSPALQTGPTVTASGRQVKSRATGVYGESLLSGQVTEGASPANGDFVQSEGSEEAEGGRPTRNSTSRPTNGWSKGRANIETYNSVDEMDEEDDATSWDGGDEDEDGDDRDQMDLDDDEDDDDDAADDDGGEDDDEGKSLLVRLKYPKGSFEGEGESKDANPESTTGEPPAAAPVKDSPADSELAPVPAPTTNGLSAQQTSKVPLPVESEPALPPTPKVEPPAVQPAFSAPTPPYAAAEENAPKPQQYNMAPVVSPDQHPPFQLQQQPQQPTTATSWQ
ncbi:hypothetical protein BU24DRAFT_374029 [Aaosphaeria arxii CBS 175.79]|uniref:WHIM1 domain-containing protein n=1 Tax=Aaosphaeria arxii CBS 175.79 TaxID=1450172 RepID=A0A6A5XHA7_9PLEO|nr:uncharacterized protein BU24DRAFT_374029 [Aaosphaeria arxii CBS 175.79]KAF2012482.1 hypothetical protein BU24DRAFT_374029 [Aaosphaeria arxii CBS 175.79]